MNAPSNATAFRALAERFGDVHVAVVGDFCLDRYFEIDPARAEVSIETGLAVHNVVRTRTQPGGAGTVLNNLAALGIGRLSPVGFAGEDGEGWELRRALASLSGVSLEHFLTTAERATFTYSKPLVMDPGKAPRELERLDTKNWTPTPGVVAARLRDSVRALAESVDAVVLLEQVDVAETGVLTREVLDEIANLAARRPQLFMIADSRRSLDGYPPAVLKMNRDEFERLARWSACPASDGTAGAAAQTLEARAASLARARGQAVVVTLAADGILAATPGGEVTRAAALPVRGEIDIVGAGDAVTASLSAAVAAGAKLGEALPVAMAAASVVVHKLGTTGTASVGEVASLLEGSARSSGAR